MGVAPDLRLAGVGCGDRDPGGDFLDGVIAYEGRWLGGETVVSFDQKAVALLSAQGESARIL